MNQETESGTFSIACGETIGSRVFLNGRGKRQRRRRRRLPLLLPIPRIHPPKGVQWQGMGVRSVSSIASGTLETGVLTNKIIFAHIQSLLRLCPVMSLDAPSMCHARYVACHGSVYGVTSSPDHKVLVKSSLHCIALHLVLTCGIIWPLPNGPFALAPVS